FPGVQAFGLPGVLGPVWGQMFDAGRGAVGAAMFFLLASLGSFMFLAGRWQARWGTLRLMALGALLAGASAVLLAFASSLWMVYAWAYLNGVSQCFIYIPAMNSVQQWFPARRGLVSGLVNLVFGLAPALTAPFMAGLLGGLGYAGLNLAVGAAGCAVMLAAAPFCAPPGPHETPAAGPVRPGAGPGLAGSWTARQALGSAKFWRLWATTCLVGAAGIAMVTLSTAFGLSLGLPLQRAVWVLLGFNLGSGVSRLVLGYLSDHLQRAGVMALAFLLAGAAYLALPWAGSLGLAAALAGCVGVAFGAMFAVGAPLAADVFGPRHFGEIFGLLFTSYGFISGAIGPALGGWLLDATNGNFTLVFGYLGVFCLTAAGLVRGVR
ncbi:MAG: MFS transporter, partial [Thermodesulfobacteriota bacterium]